MNFDPQNPIVVTRVASDLEAAAIVTALDAHGILATTTGGYTAGFRAEAPGLVSVQVRSEDLERAREVLRELERTRGQTDWSNVEVGDPADS